MQRVQFEVRYASLTSSNKSETRVWCFSFLSSFVSSKLCRLIKCCILLVIIYKWILKITFLPRLYYRLSKQRGVTVIQLRKLEKYGWKVLKLNLDIKYSENCLDLNLFPKFLKFKPFNLQVYRNPAIRGTFLCLLMPVPSPDK